MGTLVWPVWYHAVAAQQASRWCPRKRVERMERARVPPRGFTFL